MLDFDKGPDHVNTRPSTLKPAAITCAYYMPSEPDWPHIVLTMFPAKVAPPSGLGRSCYTWEAFKTEGEALDFLTKIGRHFKRAGVSLAMKAPDKAKWS